MGTAPPWWAKGLLFENCNCTAVCPAHFAFTQRCTHERCIGHWAIRIDEGQWGEVPLAGSRAFIMADAPQLMIEGGWTQELYIDAGASAPQREALEQILTGRAGSGWAVLGQFVAERIGPIFAPIRIDEQGRGYSVEVHGVAQSTVEWIKGVDPGRPATLHNLINQIHGPEHGLALGRTQHQGERIRLQVEGTHALWSTFSWRGP